MEFKIFYPCCSGYRPWNLRSSTHALEVGSDCRPWKLRSDINAVVAVALESEDPLSMLLSLVHI